MLAQVEGAIALIPQFGDCALLDNSPGLRTIQVLHIHTPGAIASRFKLEAGPGMTMTYVSEVHHIPMTVGNTQTGISICYGSCSLDQLLVTVTYMAFGTSDNCSQIRVVPHPAAYTVEAMRCDRIPVYAVARNLYVQRVPGDCGCPDGQLYPGLPQPFDCGPVPVRATTWGGIKALYTD